MKKINNLVVLIVAEYLMLRDNSTTNLDIKEELRSLGFEASQEDISNSMTKLLKKISYIVVHHDQQNYRIYTHPSMYVDNTELIKVKVEELLKLNWNRNIEWHNDGCVITIEELPDFVLQVDSLQGVEVVFKEELKEYLTYNLENNEPFNLPSNEEENISQDNTDKNNDDNSLQINVNFKVNNTKEDNLTKEDAFDILSLFDTLINNEGNI